MSDVSNRADITVEQFKKFFNAYRGVSSYLTIDEGTKKHVEQKEIWTKRLKESEFPVAFFGSFSAGKSTIINAILGKEVLPEATQSVTAFPTIIRKRKGDTDSAFVYYIDDEIKDQLWNQLCVEIGEKTGNKTISRKPQESYEKHIERVKSEVSKHEQSTKGKIDKKPLETLTQLFQGWNNEKYAVLKESISLSSLKDYIEGHPDALFVDRIEVYLSEIDIPSDIVLVDLPGLAVANQRHVEFTKEYIQEKAKAFVVCMKPKHLLEGQEIEFLEETNRDNPTILKRSFWVINQWDTLNDQQRQEESLNFDRKVQQYGFSISHERFFKFSALNYLLLICIASETLYTPENEKLKSHLGNLAKIVGTEDVNSISPDRARTLIDNEEVKPFSHFKDSLFNYLDTVAKYEFIEDAKGELLQLLDILGKNLEPLYAQCSQGADIESEFHAVEVSRQSNEFIEKLEGKVRDFAMQARVSMDGTLWKDSDTNQVEQEVDRRISHINREKLKNGLREGIDVQGNLSRLPTIVEKEVGLTLLMRERMAAVTDSHFVQRLSKLLLGLKEINKDYLPDSVLNMLIDKLSSRDIVMRLHGLADSLFYDYGEELERIGLSLKECTGTSLDERTDAALDKYKSELITFIKGLVDELNKYICGSVKNHVEYLEEDLTQLLKQQSEVITTQVARKIKVSEAVALEQKKRTAVKNSYATFVNLRSEL